MSNNNQIRIALKEQAMKAADISQVTETILSLERGINEYWNKENVDGVLVMCSEDATTIRSSNRDATV